MEQQVVAPQPAPVGQLISVLDSAHDWWTTIRQITTALLPAASTTGQAPPQSSSDATAMEATREALAPAENAPEAPEDAFEHSPISTNLRDATNYLISVSKIAAEAVVEIRANTGVDVVHMADALLSPSPGLPPTQHTPPVVASPAVDEPVAAREIELDLENLSLGSPSLAATPVTPESASTALLPSPPSASPAVVTPPTTPADTSFPNISGYLQQAQAAFTSMELRESLKQVDWKAAVKTTAAVVGTTANVLKKAAKVKPEKVAACFGEEVLAYTTVASRCLCAVVLLSAAIQLLACFRVTGIAASAACAIGIVVCAVESGLRKFAQQYVHGKSPSNTPVNANRVGGASTELLRNRDRALMEAPLTSSLASVNNDHHPHLQHGISILSTTGLVSTRGLSWQHFAGIGGVAGGVLGYACGGMLDYCCGSVGTVAVAAVYTAIAVSFLLSARRIAQATLKTSKAPSLKRLAIHAVMQVCNALQADPTTPN